MAEKSTEKKNAKVKLKDRAKAFFKNLKSEYKKIAWPTRKSLGKQTVAVIVISAVLCAFIRLIDVIGQYLVGLVSQL